MRKKNWADRLVSTVVFLSKIPFHSFDKGFFPNGNIGKHFTLISHKFFYKKNPAVNLPKLFGGLANIPQDHNRSYQLVYSSDLYFNLVSIEILWSR